MNRCRKSPVKRKPYMNKTQKRRNPSGLRLSYLCQSLTEVSDSSGHLDYFTMNLEERYTFLLSIFTT